MLRDNQRLGAARAAPDTPHHSAHQMCPPLIKWRLPPGDPGRPADTKSRGADVYLDICTISRYHVPSLSIREYV
jgi:hypothetical protein